MILIAAAIHFTLGWTKSLPVTIGRPRLRIVTHGLETLVAIPLVAVLGAEWGATGAAVAVLASTLVFAGAWLVVITRLRAEVARRAAERDGAPVVRVVVVSGIWPPDPGGPASHAPALADFLAERGHAVEVVTTADCGAGRAVVSGHVGGASIAAAPCARLRCSFALPRAAPTSSTRRA